MGALFHLYKCFSYFLKAEEIKADLDKVLDYRGGPADHDDGVEARTAEPGIKYAWTQPASTEVAERRLNAPV